MKKLVLVLMCMIFVSVFVNASITLDKTTGTIEVDQGESATIQLTIKNDNSNYDFTNVNLAIEDINNFKDSGNNQIAISFSDNGFNLSINDSRTVTITVTAEEDQYLGELTGNIIITAGSETRREFALTVNTQADNIVDITLEDGDLDEDIYPGDSVSFSINVDNTAGYDLEDVQVTVWVVDLNDGKDKKITSKKVDIDSPDEDDFDFDIEIPYNVDEDDYDIKVEVTGEEKDDSDNSFELIKIFNNAVDVTKEEDEDVYFGDVSVPEETLTCGDSFTVNVNVINIGFDDLDDAYMKLTVEGTDISIKSEEFSLESDQYDDREQDIDFLVKLPSGLDKESYRINVLFYTEDDDVIGSVYKTINIKECNAEQDNTNEETDDETTDEETTDDEDNTVYLPTGWTTKFFSSENGKTIFWFMGNLALLVIIVYFVTVLVRKKSVKK